MSLRVRDLLTGQLDELRHEPIDKRIRATVAGTTVLDSTRALLVWEPRRIVPSYAVPIDDIDGEVVPAPPDEDDATGADDVPVLTPRAPFTVHSAAGEPVRITGPWADGEAAIAAFRPADAALEGYALVDFHGPDAWFEEDERNVGHPRDPFHRIDIVRGSRHVRVEHDGLVLAESHTPWLLFEPPLPVRYYLPREDVRLDLLRPSTTATTCAYKGHTSAYWALDSVGDVAWCYDEPLREAAPIAGAIAFFNERVDVIVDGVAAGRPVTQWSRD